MISYGRQNIDHSDIKAVIKVLSSAWLTQGPMVKKFEQKLAKYCGTKYAVAVVNGTAALHLAYLAAGLKQGDEVITTPNSFVATSNMILALGAKPIFVDITLDTYNLDVNKISEIETSILITSKTLDLLSTAFIEASSKNKSLEMLKNQESANVSRVFKMEFCPTCLQDVPEFHRHNIFNAKEAEIKQIEKELGETIKELSRISNEQIKQKEVLRNLESERAALHLP